MLDDHPKSADDQPDELEASEQQIEDLAPPEEDAENVKGGAPRTIIRGTAVPQD